MQKALSVFHMGKRQVIIGPVLGLTKGHSPGPQTVGSKGEKEEEISCGRRAGFCMRS